MSKPTKNLFPDIRLFWFCWFRDLRVKITPEPDCIPPDISIALRMYFDSPHHLQDFINILRVDGYEVDTTDVVQENIV